MPKSKHPFRSLLVTMPDSQFEIDRREVERREHWPETASCPINPVAAGRLLHQIQTIEENMDVINAKINALCAKTDLTNNELQLINNKLSGGVSYISGVRSGAIMVIFLIAGAAALLVALMTGKISLSELMSHFH